MADPQAQDALAAIEDYLGCENDEGHGCDCNCPGRRKAYAALAVVRARLEEAYASGESSGYADWIGALADSGVAAPEGGWLPSTTADLIAVLSARLEALEQERDMAVDLLRTLIGDRAALAPIPQEDTE